jgi:hypothetical protein
LVESLRSNDWAARRQAVTEIAAIPVAQRSREMLDAIVQEIDRLHGLAGRGAEDAPKEAGLHAGWDYYTDVVYLAAESSDPAVIRPLVENMDAGRPVRDALARFGPAAAAPLLESIKSHNPNDLGYMVDALPTLRMLLEQNANLAAPIRAGITELVAQRLSGKQHSAVVGLAIGIAAVLHDQKVTAMVQAIDRARSASEVGLVLLDADLPDRKSDSFGRVQAQARAALGAEGRAKV